MTCSNTIVAERQGCGRTMLWYAFTRQCQIYKEPSFFLGFSCETKKYLSFLNPLTTNIPNHLEISQLISNANQLTGFYMMGNTGRSWVNLFNPFQTNIPFLDPSENIKSPLVFWCFLMFSFFTNLVFFPYFFLFLFCFIYSLFSFYMILLKLVVDITTL